MGFSLMRDHVTKQHCSVAESDLPSLCRRPASSSLLQSEGGLVALTGHFTPIKATV